MAELTAVEVPGAMLGDFKKTQYLGHMEGMLTQEKPRDRIREIHELANKAMHHVHKENKHRHLGFAKCFVTSKGIYLYEAEEKVNVQATCSWSKEAKEIYCVVLGKRQHLFHNCLACIMRFADPTKKPVLPVAVDCAVIEFHHDHKNRAAQFHKACEEMMKQLLYDEMAKLSVGDDAAAAEPAAEPAAAPAAEAPAPVSDVPPGYMDVPQPINNVGKKARKSIDMSLDAGDDYMVVVAGNDVFDDRLGDDDGGASLADILKQVDEGEDDE
eukprot:m.112813 g.112813  ORF g.112813 m.112813 type:complete len:270 (+) comp17043_c0_seq2:141-950(+)